MAGSVLVLNQNYEPLNVCSWRRAMVLLALGKAEVLEYSTRSLRSATAEFECPSVVLLTHMIKRPRPVVKLTRREIIRRDNNTCQYCGQRGLDLTIDHVLPKHRGGGHTWANLVAACKSCNHRKGGRTPEEARMKLLRPATTPALPLCHNIYQRAGRNLDTKWYFYVPGLQELVESREVAVA